MGVGASDESTQKLVIFPTLGIFNEYFSDKDVLSMSNKMDTKKARVYCKST